MPSCCVFVKACCCVPKKKCFTIGYMNLAVSMILIFEFALPLASNGKSLAVIAYNDIDIENEKVYVTGIAMAIVFTFIICLFNLVYDIVLLVGMHMNRPELLKAYLVYSLIFLIIAVVYCICNIPTAHTVPAGVIIVIVVFIIFKVCSLLAIRNMYFQMNKPSVEREGED